MPADWAVERRARRVTMRPEDGPEALIVTSFRLHRRYRPDLWDEALAELEVVARELAAKLAPGAQLSRGRTRVIDGARARVYDIRYERGRERLLERIAFLFKGTREYQLTCRIDAAAVEPGTDACRLLFEEFDGGY